MKEFNQQLIEILDELDIVASDTSLLNIDEEDLALAETILLGREFAWADMLNTINI